MRTWILGVMIAAVVAGVGGVAVADDRALAKQEFQAGLEADRRKDYSTAIQHYLRAYELAPHENALFNIAVDYERIGELRDAATYYGRYLDEAGETEDRGKVTRLMENLRKRSSQVSIRTTPPGGQISVDGAPVGQAPLTRELVGGTHMISATQGSRRSQRQITLEYGEPAEVVLALSEQQGTLSITSNVDGAQVEIDGAPAGVTPLAIAVPAGDRKVIVRSDGYATLERQVRVPAEGSAQITATLVRPIGFTAPVSETKPRGYVFSVGGGTLIQVDTNVIQVGIGYRLFDWEAAWLIGFFGEGRYGYGLQFRRYLTSGRFRPFVGAFGQLGATSSTASTTAEKISILGGTFGLALDIAHSDRYTIELTVEGGAAMFSAAGERELAFPITAGLQFRGGQR